MSKDNEEERSEMNKKESNDLNEEVTIGMEEDSEEVIIKSGDFSIEHLPPFARELVGVGILFLASLIIFKLIFHQENLLVVIKGVAAIFYLFILPGFAVLLYWKEKISYFERLIMALPLGAAITGSFGFLLGLVGIKMGIQIWLVPIVCLGLGWWFGTRKNSSKDEG